MRPNSASTGRLQWLFFVTLGVLTVLGPNGPARADVLALKYASIGRHSYVLVGQALTDNSGLTNGTRCLLPAATATVATAMVPARASLERAVLYLSGSLLDDGVDFPDGTQIFSPGAGRRANVGADVDAVTASAQFWAAASASLQLPGADAPLPVVATAPAYVTVDYISSGPEMGNIGFFTRPIDITELLLGPGRGVLTGAYQVSGVRADVCRGLEVTCTADGSASCATTSAVDSHGTASFALLLQFADPGLPLRSLNVFEGLLGLFANQVVLPLQLSQPISDPAQGSLSAYILEGDLSIGGPNPNSPCGGDEFIRVDGSGGQSLCLNDADNPVGNVFNGSINTQPRLHPPAAPSCMPVAQCCLGPHACGLAGVDIDTFDISAALQPGGLGANVTVGTASDRVALATLVLDVAVFAAELHADSRLDVPEAVAGMLQVGGPVTYRLGVSNTGNLPATGVQVDLQLPPQLVDVQLLRQPAGAQVVLTADTGEGRRLRAHGFDVGIGKVAELRLQGSSRCGSLGQSLVANANLIADGLSPFAISSASLVSRGPGVGACRGLDPSGPLALLEPVSQLQGGGCQSTPGAAPGVFPYLLALLALARRRRSGSTQCAASTPNLRHSPPRPVRSAPCPRRSDGRATRHLAWLAALTLSLALTVGCSPASHGPASVPPLTSFVGLPGTACGGDPRMLQLTAPDGHHYCIDRFEAQVVGGQAEVRLGGLPMVNMTWYAAAAACAAAGKRLCEQDEWVHACGGAPLSTYPYGDTQDDGACNGYLRDAGTGPLPAGASPRCHGVDGVYDLTGNVEEWLATPQDRTPGSQRGDDRAVRGGSWRSNATFLACRVQDVHADPTSQADDRGFRCCH